MDNFHTSFHFLVNVFLFTFDSADVNAFQPEGQSPNQKNFFQNSFFELQNRFLGTLGKQILGGEDPQARFTDFLGEVNFGNEFAKTPPNQRGGAPTSFFNPPTRSIFF